VIDFRYHLVSLVAVFLALAVGVVLGAGPLREAIGAGVTGQTADLRQQVDDLTSQRDAAVADRDAATAALDAAGAGLLDGALPGYRVAVVTLGDVDGGTRAALDERLTQAGAVVSAHAALAGAWTDPEQRSFRQGLTGYLLDYLDPVPPAAAGAEAELAQALVQGLTAADPADPDTPSEDATLLLELLTTGETPLVTLGAPVTAPADAVVVLATGATGDQDAATAALALLRSALDRARGAVLVEPAAGPGPLVAAVLADAGAGELATVSGADGVVGQLATPLALAQRIAGTVGHYGTGTGLSPIPPRTALGPPDRAPAAP